MICITHTGKIGDLAHVMPICSWIYKKYNEKIIFVFQDEYPFIKQMESLLRLQEFTEDVRYAHGLMVNHFDMGGQPYIFNPNDYIENLNCSKYYNIGFRSKPDKFIPEFYAEEHDLGVDYDFVLNLDLQFNMNSENIMCSEVTARLFPFYEQPDFSKDFLTNLQKLAYAKERHLHFSSLASWLSWAGVPFYLYTLVKWQPWVDVIEFDRYDSVSPDAFWMFYKNASVLDVLGLNDDNKIVSQYNRVFLR